MSRSIEEPYPYPPPSSHVQQQPCRKQEKFELVLLLLLLLLAPSFVGFSKSKPPYSSSNAACPLCVRLEVSGVDWNLVSKGVFASSSWDGTVKLWEPGARESSRTFRDHGRHPVYGK